MSKDIIDQVKSIANKLSEGFTEDEVNSGGEPMSAYDYLSDALDIEYIVSRDGSYLGARVLVAFGGPNIWINTRTKTVEGYWWSDSHFEGFTDSMDLDAALEELWECR
jgi:hypothetical protein